MSKQAHNPAFPQPLVENQGRIDNSNDYGFGGLTKREYFAAMAMQSIILAAQTSEESNRSLLGLANSNRISPSQQIGKMACEQADMLLEALEKEQK